jgi:hypothetical protein
MRQFWVGLIVVIVALALGVGAAFGSSVLVRNRMANLPSIRANPNLPSSQPGNNSRRNNNPQMNPGGRQGFGPFNFRNWGGSGPLMGPGRSFRNFYNCPAPNQGQKQGNGQGQTPGQPQTNCLPFRRFNGPVNPNTPNNGPATPTPNTLNNGSGKGPF